MMRSSPVSRRSSRAQITRFFLEGQPVGTLLNGRAELVNQAIAFDDVAVGAKIHGVDGRVDGGHAGNENEGGGRRNFPAIAQEFDSVHIRHADVGHHDVKHLRGEAALGHFAAGGHFHFVALLAETDFEQLADRALVVDDQQLGHARLPLPHGTRQFGGGIEFCC